MEVDFKRGWTLTHTRSLLLQNLGLGVFEAKRKDDASDTSDDHESDDNDDIIIPSSSSKPTSTEKPNIQLLHSEDSNDDKHP